MIRYQRIAKWSCGDLRRVAFRAAPHYDGAANGFPEDAMPTATINGIELYYERHGERGDALVLMHGYTGDVTDWRFQIPEFSATHRVLTFDHRGHGRSQAPADRRAYGIDQMSHDAEALIAQVGFERYHLVGHSMGGAIAQEIALRSPDRLLSLTLHDTGFHFDRNRNEGLAKWNRARNKIAEEQGMAALAAMPSPFKTPPHLPAGRDAETRERMARMSVDGFIGAGDGLNSWRGTKDRLDQVAVPTLVIYGDLDVPMLVKAGEILSERIAGATRVIVREAAHCPQEELPDLFNAALRTHIEKHAAPAR
jgi:3-oxoadipate enol-lactonase